MIKHRKRMQQIRDFKGLAFGTILPTDIDGLIEYRGRCFVLFELKMAGTELPYGQRLALERVCDALEESKPTILIIGEHTEAEDDDIDCAEARVVEYRMGGRWCGSWRGKKVRRLVERFLTTYGDRVL